MIARQRSIGRTAAAVFLLFAAAPGVTPAEASIPRAGDVERGVPASDTGRPPALTGATLTTPTEAPRPTFPLGATLPPPRIGPSLVLSGAAPTLALFPLFTPEAASGAGWKSRYVTEDELGNVTHLTDQSGSVVERYQYEGYGKFRIFDPTNSARTVSSFGWNRLFQGREYLGVVDAYDFRARILWPELGRFGQEDPEGSADSENPYQAVLGAWTKGTDPYGLWTFDSSLNTAATKTAVLTARVVAQSRNLLAEYRSVNPTATLDFLKDGRSPHIVALPSALEGEANGMTPPGELTTYLDPQVPEAGITKYPRAGAFWLSSALVMKAATSPNAAAALVITLLHEQVHIEALKAHRADDPQNFKGGRFPASDRYPNLSHLGNGIELRISNGGVVKYDAVTDKTVIWSGNAGQQSRAEQLQQLRKSKKALIESFGSLTNVEGYFFDTKTLTGYIVDIDSGRTLYEAGYFPTPTPSPSATPKRRVPR